MPFYSIFASSVDRTSPAEWLLPNGGCGLSYANDIGRFIAYAWGTRFQVSPSRMAVFSSYLLNGEQWMIRGRIFDYSAIGREITPKGLAVVPRDWSVSPAHSLGNVIAMLAAEPVRHQREFQQFAVRLALGMFSFGCLGLLTIPIGTVTVDHFCPQMRAGRTVRVQQVFAHI